MRLLGIAAAAALAVALLAWTASKAPRRARPAPPALGPDADPGPAPDGETPAAVVAPVPPTPPAAAPPTRRRAAAVRAAGRGRVALFEERVSPRVVSLRLPPGVLGSVALPGAVPGRPIAPADVDLAGFRVRAHDAAGGTVAVAVADDGTFAVPDRPAPSTFSLEAPAGWSAVSTSGQDPDRPRLVAVRRATGTLSLFVRGEDGRPPRRTVLALSAPDLEFEAEVDASGRVEVAGLPPGPVRVEARAPGYEPARETYRVPPRARRVHTVELALPPDAGAVAGRVLLAPETRPGTCEMALLDLESGFVVDRTDVDWDLDGEAPYGRFRFGRVPHGHYRVFALRASGVRLVPGAVEVAPPETDLAFRGAPTGDLVLSFVDGRTLRPVLPRASHLGYRTILGPSAEIRDVPAEGPLDLSFDLGRFGRVRAGRADLRLLESPRGDGRARWILERTVLTRR